MAEAAAGDIDALARIVSAHHDDMARLAFVICGDQDLAQDAVQAAWPVAWRKLGTLRDPASLRPWLMSVAANEARQLIRHKRRHPVVQIEVADIGSTHGDPGSGPDWSTWGSLLVAFRPTTGRSSRCVTWRVSTPRRSAARSRCHRRAFAPGSHASWRGCERSSRMPEPTFEQRLGDLVRSHSENGVRPIDAHAIAASTVATGRSSMRWRFAWPLVTGRSLTPVLVGLLVLALVATAIVIGGRLLRPSPLVSVPEPSASADPSPVGDRGPCRGTC